MSNIEQAWAAFDRMLAEHEEHDWRQVGRCVYCQSCDVRLYQGTLPANRKPKPQPRREPAATTEMRKRWAK
jgi:hypothetical protein